MKYMTRRVKPEEVKSALNLARKVFTKFVAPIYTDEAINKFIKDCIDNEEYINNYISGNHIMLIALDKECIIGLISERGNANISMLFIDENYHRQGVATAIMEKMVVELRMNGFNKITLDSSPYALPFYHSFGFTEITPQQNINGFIFTPMQYIPNELWDIYDKNRIKSGKIVERGRKMRQDEYHIVVHVWIKNSKNEFLISKRTPNKSYPNMWECTGGSAIVGEDSYDAAIREAKEEMGVDLSKCNGRMILSYTRQHYDFPDFCDVWLFYSDLSIEDVTYQEGETCDATWANENTINKMIEDREFIGKDVFPYIDIVFGM